MHLKENCNLTDFFHKIKECSGQVTFKTSEGDVLVLQSTLCRYIFASLQQQPALLYGGVITCAIEDDYKVLKDFLCES